MFLYHYTNGLKIAAIVNAGILMATPEKPKPGEKRVVWFSSNPLWEKTANKIVSINGEEKLLDMKGTEKYTQGLFRIKLKKESMENLYGWPLLAAKARIPENIKKRLTKRAKAAKVNAQEWFGVIGDVELKEFVVEKMINDRWIEIVDYKSLPVPKYSSVALNKSFVSNQDWKKI